YKPIFMRDAILRFFCGNMLRLSGTVNRGRPYCQTIEEGDRPRSGQACRSTSCSVIVAGMLRAGALTIHFLNDGFWWDDGGAQFGIVPRELWEKEKPANARHRIKLSLTCPLIVTDRELGLVDTGIGYRMNDRVQANYTPARGEALAATTRG